MKINFVANDTDRKRGSYRIHVDDLSYYLNQVGASSSINGDGQVNIYDKSLEPSRSGLSGCITPNCVDVPFLKKFDFAIVGSVEERESLIGNLRHVFIFPQIERMYLNLEPKEHHKKDELVIGYHGNPNHLNHMSLGLQSALERLSKKAKIKLLVGMSSLCPISNWRQGRPNVPTEYFSWDLKTISHNVFRFDIGITPNISGFKFSSFKDENTSLGKYNSDIQIRFKNKSNIGRNLVLIQHGIPVVTDMTPSCLHIFANPENGYAVLTEEGWYWAIKALLDPNHRNFVSRNAYQEYKRLYNPLKWAMALYEDIERLYYDRKK